MKQRIIQSCKMLILPMIIYIILSALIFNGTLSEYVISTMTLAGIYIIVALSVNLISGFTGQLSLGQAGFMSIGAYSSAMIAKNMHVPVFAAIVAGGIITAIFGMIIGFPTLRLRGDYLAITTLGFGEIIRVVAENMGNLTGGAAGLKDIPILFENVEDIQTQIVLYFTAVFVIVVVAVIVVRNLIDSAHGKALISIREDEIAANSMGINVSYYKVFAFTLSSFIAGIGGGLYVTYMGGYLNPSLFGFMVSFDFVAMVVLGGLGSITGTIIGSIAITFIREMLRETGDFRMLIFGLILVILMLFRPKGIFGTKEITDFGILRKFFKKEKFPDKVLNVDFGGAKNDNT